MKNACVAILASLAVSACAPPSLHGVKFTENLIEDFGVYNDEVFVDLYTDNLNGEDSPLSAEEIARIISVIYDATQEMPFAEHVVKDRVFANISVVVSDNPDIANQLYWDGVAPPALIPDTDSEEYQVLSFANGFLKQPDYASYTIFVNNISLNKNPNKTPAEVMTGLIVHETTHVLETMLDGFEDFSEYSRYSHDNAALWTDLRALCMSILEEES